MKKTYREMSKKDVQRLVVEFNNVLAAHDPYDAKVIIVIGDFVNAQVFHNFKKEETPNELILEMLRRTASNYEYVQLQTKPSVN